MKKSFWMVLLLAVVMVLAACGGKEEKKEETPNKQETTTAKPEEKKDESKSDENFFFQKGDVKVVMNEPAKAIIEALGEYKEVAPGESLVHTETLSVQKAKRPLPDLDDERDVHDFVWTHHE